MEFVGVYDLNTMPIWRNSGRTRSPPYTTYFIYLAIYPSTKRYTYIYIDVIQQHQRNEQGRGSRLADRNAVSRIRQGRQIVVPYKYTPRSTLALQPPREGSLGWTSSRDDPASPRLIDRQRIPGSRRRSPTISHHQNTRYPQV